MREIKFRAWDGEVMGDIKYMHLPASSDDFIKVMQYTGLKDRNGKEIYESDIVTVESNGLNRYQKRVVCYDSNQAKYKTVPLGTYLINAGNGGWTGYDLRWICEIVGNIHENPELLEES